MSSVISNPIRVPEFPISSLIVLVITFSTIILFSKLRQFR